jgi:pantoate--beta-alanine ligase
VLIFTKIAELRSFLTVVKKQKKTVGFVPTMGALHPGHISLIQASKSANDLTVCSIFVNPTQFNDKNDLARYPRTPETDSGMLKNAGCDVLFMPEVEEMYPDKDERTFEFGYLDKILDGAHRPGHFNGVAQIVSRLFEIVQPTRAFFGSKDYQQLLIIKELVKQMSYPVEIVACPVIREADGLAMSSRNALLNASERQAASLIPRLMKEAAELKQKGVDVNGICLHVKTTLEKVKIYRLDYFAICNAENLREIKSFPEAAKPIALIACFVGKIRLIDNLILD